MTRRSTSATLLSATLLSVSLLGQSLTPPPFAGTWQLDITQSTYSPGPMPRSQRVVYEAVDGGLSVVADRVEADGRMVHFEWMARFDGRDYPVAGDPGRDSVSVVIVDPFQLDFTNKKDGKVTTRHTVVYSRNGRSRVETIDGVNASGHAVHNVTVWNKE